MDTDIGSPLSTPRSHTGSWPYRKCEHLTDKMETQHIITGAKKFTPLGLSLSLLLTASFSSSRCRQPILILAELTPRCRQQSNTHTQPLLDSCAVQLLCAHKSPPPQPLLSYPKSTGFIIHLHPIEAPACSTSVVEPCPTDQDSSK